MRFDRVLNWRARGLPAYGMHLGRFLFRLCVFLSVLVCYLLAPGRLDLTRPWREIGLIAPGHILCVILLVAMLRLHRKKPGMSMGRLKQYPDCAVPDLRRPPEEIRAAVRRKNLGALKVLAVWLAGNAVVALLYFRDRIGVAELVLLCAFYYLSDIICILFFCPFQLLFLGNRCCINCRIFAWGSWMTATPLVLLPAPLPYAVVVLSLTLLARWEYHVFRSPENFWMGSNRNLRCESCTERLCRTKLYPPLREE